LGHVAQDMSSSALGGWRTTRTPSPQKGHASLRGMHQGFSKQNRSRKTEASAAAKTNQCLKGEPNLNDWFAEIDEELGRDDVCSVGRLPSEGHVKLIVVGYDLACGDEPVVVADKGRLIEERWPTIDLSSTVSGP